MNQPIHWGKVAVLVVAIVGIATVFYVVGMKSNEVAVAPQAPAVQPPAKTETVKNAAVTQPTVQPKADETAGWKTYRSEKYGFEFKYPEGAQITETQMGGDEVEVRYKVAKGFMYGSKDNAGVLLSFKRFDDLNAVSLDVPVPRTSLADLMKSPSFVSAKSTTFEGSEAFTATFKNDSLGYEGTETYVSRDGKIYSVSYDNSFNKDTAIRDAIVSSFVFTK